ncbi:MAG: PucR family transcriptional regulator, partial [Mycobacteriales bacterium]
LDTQSLGTYRAGQNAAWQAWMAACFRATSDPAELQDLLQESARSIFTYVEATVASITALVEGEREGLVHSTHTQRLEAVTLVLDGALVDVHAASARLGHDLRPAQVAAVLWRDPGSAETGQLEQAAQAVGAALGRSRPLTVVATALSLWAWYPTDVAPDAEAVARATAATPGVRIALGAGGPGVAGFRSSHLDALATQRLMLRAGPELRVASYPDVEVVELLASNEERAHELVQRTLGPLLGADPVLRETLRTYLREGMSASRTARVLFAHRNTVLNRLERAEQLLPLPLAGRTLHVALALEVVHWLGTPGAEPADGQG